MSKLNLRGIHVFKKVPGSPGAFRLAEINPALRLSNGPEQVWLQKGSFYASNGDPIPQDKLPGWLPSALEATSTAALAEAGYRGNAKPKAAPAASKRA